MRLLAFVLAVLLSSCGGGSSATIPDVVLSEPSQIVTIPGGGRFSATVTFEDAFRCSTGHAGVMLRADLSALPGGPNAGHYRGHGVALGFGGPVAVIETWAVGAVEPEFASILWQTASPPLQDWTPYPLLITSEPTAAGNVIRFRLGDHDSGDVIDINPVIDMGGLAIALFNTAGGTCPYAIRFTGISTE